MRSSYPNGSRGEGHGRRPLAAITYDREVDAHDEAPRRRIAADYDSDGRLAGIEILDAISRLGDPRVLRQVILEGVGPSRD
jgi:hypothetical protein